MKKIVWILGVTLLLGVWSCSSGGEQKPVDTPVGSINQVENPNPKAKTIKKASTEPQQKTVQPEEKSENIGVGPITKAIPMGDIDPALVSKGETSFKTKCAMCHSFNAKIIGPPLQCITKQRSGAWIMNMMMNPDKMIKEDPDAKKLFEEFKTPMSNMSIKQDEARAILEFLRTKC